MVRRAAATGAWCVAMVAAAWALFALGRLEWIRVDWADPVGWMASTDPEAALAALARLAGLAIVTWSGLSTVVYAIARLLGVDTGAIDWLSFGPIRRSIDALLAGYMVLGTVAPAGAVVPPETPPVATTETTTTLVTPTRVTPTTTRVDPAYVPVPAGQDRPQRAATEDEPPAAPTADPEPEAPDGASIVVVRTGDSLWSIAEQRLAEAWGRAPSDVEIAPYWAGIVETNRARLRSGDPDLIFAGEEVDLPGLPGQDGS